jgi:RHS repeat-associated protein
VIGLVDGNTGVMVAEYRYSAYGSLLETSGETQECNLRFSTKYFDRESGFYYFAYRYYSPILGRWITQDPLGHLEGMVLYKYARNNPIRGIDPLGLLTWISRPEMKLTRNDRMEDYPEGSVIRVTRWLSGKLAITIPKYELIFKCICMRNLNILILSPEGITVRFYVEMYHQPENYYGVVIPEWPPFTWVIEKEKDHARDYHTYFPSEGRCLAYGVERWAFGQIWNSEPKCREAIEFVMRTKLEPLRKRVVDQSIARWDITGKHSWNIENPTSQPPANGCGCTGIELLLYLAIIYLGRALSKRLRTYN